MDMDVGILYIIATPIGNLADITFRAIEVLSKVDKIICEDTRTTKKLLDHYKISTPTMSFYKKIKKRSSIKPVPRLEEIVSLLTKGSNIAFVSDAGTPGISDPGNQLVAQALAINSPVIPIPGVSALTTLISVAGIDLSQFIFLGFPPHKKGRETFFEEIKILKYPVIYFESPHRVIKNLTLIKKLEIKKNIILGREMTKIFEEIVRGRAEDVLAYFSRYKDKVRGEIVVIIY
jgi:16S rRNA (cytidine1402-2'-O)-methyltransferase